MIVDFFWFVANHKKSVLINHIKHKHEGDMNDIVSTMTTLVHEVTTFQTGYWKPTDVLCARLHVSTDNKSQKH